MLLNLTKNHFNPDQEELLKQAGITIWSEPKRVFLSCGEDLIREASGQSVCVTAPWEVVAEAISDGLEADLITWSSEETYRKQGMFVVSALKIYSVSGGGIVSKKVYQIPRAKYGNDFATGKLVVLHG